MVTRGLGLSLWLQAQITLSTDTNIAFVSRVSGSSKDDTVALLRKHSSSRVTKSTVLSSVRQSQSVTYHSPSCISIDTHNCLQ